MVKISEEKRKAFGDYMRETLGSVNSQDEDFFNRDLVQGVGGESTAEKHGTRFVLLIIIEIITSIVISATTEIDGEIIWWVTIFVLLKDIAVILILNKIHDEDREAQIEWTKDKRRIATTKICLAKMGELESDVDLKEYDFREPSVLDQYDPKNWFSPF